MSLYPPDLGHGELDQSLQIEKLEQASLNTTRLVKSEINETQLLIHIGDLSYAVGFNAQVSKRTCTHVPLYTWHTRVLNESTLSSFVYHYSVG